MPLAFSMEDVLRARAMTELFSTKNDFLTKPNTERRLSADIQGSIGSDFRKPRAYVPLIASETLTLNASDVLTLSEVLTINPLSNMCRGGIIE